MMLGPHTPAAAAVEWPTNLPVRTSAALALFCAVFDWRRCVGCAGAEDHLPRSAWMLP